MAYKAKDFTLWSFTEKARWPSSLKRTQGFNNSILHGVCHRWICFQEWSKWINEEAGNMTSWQKLSQRSPAPHKTSWCGTCLYCHHGKRTRSSRFYLWVCSRFKTSEEYVRHSKTSKKKIILLTPLNIFLSLTGLLYLGGTSGVKFLFHYIICRESKMMDPHLT